jgi:translation initiation factor 3 subunit M
VFRLSNLFNAIPRQSSLRLPVYTTLLNIATAKDELQVLQISRGDVDVWLSDWNVTPEAKSGFLKLIVDAFVKTGHMYVVTLAEQFPRPTLTQSREIAYEYLLAYVRSLPPSSPLAEEAAAEAIAAALKSPSVFNFDPLFKLNAVIASKGHPLFSLLQIFLKNGLSEFSAWDNSNPGVLEKYSKLFTSLFTSGDYLVSSRLWHPFPKPSLLIRLPGLDKTQLQNKLRLLTLASLAFQYIGRDLPYSEVAERLQVDQSEVEKWVIDGTYRVRDFPTYSHDFAVIRIGLLSGKISQTSQTIHILRATSRIFEREQWEALEKRLLTWKSGLSGVLEVVETARRRGEQPGGAQTTASLQMQTAAA